MLDIRFIRENVEQVKAAVRDKGILMVDIDDLLVKDRRRRELMKEAESIRATRNQIASEIKTRTGRGKAEAIQKGKAVREALARCEADLKRVEDAFNQLMLRVPNIYLDLVPVGKSDADNVVIREWGERPHFDFELKDHVAIGRDLDIIDIQRGAAISGTRFYVLKGDGALLEQALHRFATDTLIEKGFTLLQVPVIVRDEAMVGTGFFPVGREDAYRIEQDELNLIGTSEVSITSYHQGEVLKVDTLPKMYLGATTCFRREAGTYGKDTHGLYRVHQFQKVEQVILCKGDPEESWRMHQFILNNAEMLLQSLGLPYRVSIACTGEIGQGQVIKHEIETWMPSRNAYCETNSCSSYYDFQARRLNIRYQDTDGQNRFVYTLNNTALATPRLLIPILEIYQNSDGSVRIPEVLQPYLGGRTIIESR